MNYDDQDIERMLAELPRDIQPERDLRAGIWRDIDSRERRWSGMHMAAAAVFLMIISSAVTLLVVGRNKHDVDPIAATNSSTVLVSYRKEVGDLEEVLRRHRAALSPETVKILEENLRIIDKAIVEARTALEHDPNSDMLVDLLRSAYERKLELLRQAAKSSST